MLRRLMVLALLIIALLQPGMALAHQPFFNDRGSPTRAEAYLIPEPTVSKALFGAVRSAGTIDYYRLEIVAPLDLAVRLLVPDTRACAAFSPQIILLGKGIAASGDPAGLDLSGDLQALVMATGAWGSWSGHGLGLLREGSELRAALTPGTYYLAVRDAAGATGAYLLSLAGSEQFGGEPDAPARMRAWERCDAGIAARPPATVAQRQIAPWVLRWLFWGMRLGGISPALWVSRYP